MFRTLPLMHELERRSRALGWTWERLARELGMNRTTLAHIRSGRDRLSLANLHRIAVWFPNDDTLRRLTWEYLLLDVATARERESVASPPTDLAPPTLERLSRFVHEFPSHVIRGSGLLLESDDATLLTGALAFLELEFARRAVHVVRERASSRLAASTRSNFIAIPLLLIDRIEFASPSVSALLRERHAAAKVSVVTRHLGTDPADASLLAAIAPRLTRLALAPASSRPVHV